jgi:tripartite-type tricarboxylate transporter receptor subunit TctC
VLGTNFVARAPADGYTLLFVPGSFSFAQMVVKSAGGYDPLNDFVSVIEVGKTPMFLVTGAGSGIRSFKDALSAAKSSKMSYGSAGTGSILHIVGELVNKETGANFAHIPYKGVAPAINDVLGGHIPFAYGSLSTIKPHLPSGKLVALAVTSRERTPLAPEIPTLYELGYKGVALDSWYGIFGPKSMPADAVKVLNEHFNVLLKMPDVVERMAVQGSSPVGGSPEVLARTNRTDVEVVGRIIKDLSITAE